MKRTKVIYVISRIDKAIAFEWIAMQIDRSRFDVRFVLLNEGSSHFEQFCIENKIPCKTLRLKGKKSYPRLMVQLFFLFLFQRPKVVHAHLIDATLTSMTAAWLACIPHRVYTRHHSTYHFESFPKAVRWDRWANRLSNHIVAISENVKKVLLDREHVRPRKVRIIHHGFDLDAFAKPNSEAVSRLQQQYNPENQHPVIGVIARFIELKGIQFIIPAFKKMLNTFPQARLLLFNANGDYRPTLMGQLNELPEGSWQVIAFENDIFSVYSLFDGFVHAPVNAEAEAFGQTYIEALVAGVPSVFTLSGVASEFIVDRHNALVVPFCDSEALLRAMIEMQNNKALAASMVENGKHDVQRFALKQMIEKLEQLYGE